MPRLRSLRRFAIALGATMAALLGGCGFSGTLSTQVSQWSSQGSFTTNEQQVVADVRSVQRAVASGSPLQLRTVCGGLTSDAGTLYDTLPTPDHAITNELGAAMHDFFTAAASCAVAPATRTAAVSRDLSIIDRGIAELALAGRRLARDGVRSAALPPR
jgi:hypothetical protein